MLRALFVFLACALSGALVPVAAADIVVFQRGVLIQGTIQPGDYAKLIAFVRHPDNYGRFARTVFLDSPGGDLVEAVKIAHLLEKSHAATHVVREARCYSACFILWMSGVSRNVSAGATLGVHRINVKVGGETMDPASERFASIARRVENYMAALGTPRTILDKMNATPAADMFVISQRWLVEQQLLTAVSYRLGFMDAAQAQCGPEPYAAAIKGKEPLSDEEAQDWTSRIRGWMGCADELRARNQKADVLTIAALIDGADAGR
ncbi:MAG: hypothetical protein Q8K71_15830 [Polaromonas sp.]|nr:hypothetical protein [Polaromonas sp.]MDP3752704.1 hypothetical protein [Polaromonas sp.]